MPPAPSPQAGHAARHPAIPRPALLLVGRIALVVAITLIYANTWQVPFLFDDLTAIKTNSSIRDLADFGSVLFPPADTGDTIEGRPILNLSFALNYALSGDEVWSYHAVNTGIHILNALLLLGIVWRTGWLRRRDRAGGQGWVMLAVAAALVWALHPLNTAAVTYLSRRADALAGLFLLLTLYAYLRGATAARSAGSHSTNGRLWWAVAIASCALGMATKETMAVAPLVILIYDRTFLAGSWSETCRQRGSVLIGLAATWTILAILVAISPDRGGTAGFNTGISSWHYLLTQASALILYLKLTFWPAPLIFDYGTALATSPTEVWLPALVIALLLIATSRALRTWSAAGFLGASFFLLLAPSSSLIPVATQTIAEHRMYLPLACVVLLVAAGLFQLHRALAPGILAVVAIALGFMTFDRNNDYRSEEAIWRDTVAKLPDNARAHNNLGNALVRAGDAANALPHFAEAVRLDPRSAEAHANLATALARRGELETARNHFRIAADLEPDVAEIRHGLGMTLLRMGQFDSGVRELRAARELDPANLETRYQLANALSRADPSPEAQTLFEEILTRDPQHAGGDNHLGLMIAQSGDLEGAIVHFRAAVSARPDYPEALANLGNALLRLGRPAEAVPHFEAALQSRPDMPGVRQALDYARSVR